MPDEPNSQGTGSKSSQGADASSGDAGNAQAGQQQQGAKGSVDTQTPEQRAKQSITPEILKGVLDTQARTLKGDLDKTTQSFQTQVSDLTKQISELQKVSSPSSSGSAQDKKDQQELDSPELVALRQRVKELEDSNKKAVDEAARARQQEKDYRFRTAVMDSLVRAECTKPEHAFHVVSPLLKVDPDGRIYSTVKSEFGATELDLDDFVSKHVKEKVIPELFQGMVKPGSAAGGDEGSADGKYLFDLKELQANPEQWEKNLPAVRAALEQKRVKLT
jgi:hypothetical protein